LHPRQGEKRRRFSEHGGTVMAKFRKAAVVSGVVSLTIAMLGVILLISQPAQSKNDKPKKADGVMTMLGF
jgi:hypothetical protein